MEHQEEVKILDLLLEQMLLCTKKVKIHREPLSSFKFQLTKAYTHFVRGSVIVRSHK